MSPAGIDRPRGGADRRPSQCAGSGCSEHNLEARLRRFIARGIAREDAIAARLRSSACRFGRNDACPQYCDACFTGDYPTRLTDLAERHEDQSQLALPVNKVA